MKEKIEIGDNLSIVLGIAVVAFSILVGVIKVSTTLDDNEKELSLKAMEAGLVQEVSPNGGVIWVKLDAEKK